MEDVFRLLLTNDQSQAPAAVTDFLPYKNTNSILCFRRFITTVHFKCGMSNSTSIPSNKFQLKAQRNKFQNMNEINPN